MPFWLQLQVRKQCTCEEAKQMYKEQAQIPDFSRLLEDSLSGQRKKMGRDQWKERMCLRQALSAKRPMQVG